MTRYEIREACPGDVELLQLRAEDTAEVTCGGFRSGLEALRASQAASLLAWTMLIDRQPIAMGGCAGSPLGAVGSPWLLTSSQVETLPMSFVREARAKALQLLELFPRLENWVLADYGRACRFLELIGFSLDKPMVMGMAGARFRRFWMVR